MGYHPLALMPPPTSTPQVTGAAPRLRRRLRSGWDNQCCLRTLRREGFEPAGAVAGAAVVVVVVAAAGVVAEHFCAQVVAAVVAAVVVVVLVSLIILLRQFFFVSLLVVSSQPSSTDARGVPSRLASGPHPVKGWFLLVKTHEFYCP